MRMDEKTIAEEQRRLRSIKINIPRRGNAYAIFNNVMTDKEREYYILGQKIEFEILTHKNTDSKV